MRSLVWKFSIGAATLALWSCGGGGSSSSTPTSPAPPSTNSSAITISITRQNGAQSFNPNPASAGGEPVVFKNNDSIVHRVILNDGSLDTGDIAPGATSRELMMPGVGTNYHCTIHPSMVGSVSPATGGAPPPCQGAYC